LCPAAWVDTPTTWTLFSTAWRAASSGVWEQRADIYIEADIGEGRGDDLGVAVMAVLSGLLGVP